MLDEQTLLDQSVKAYGFLLKVFVRSLRKEKRYRAATKYAGVKISTVDDVEDTDDALRTTFQYRANNPHAVAPLGFYPMLGLALDIVHMSWHFSKLPLSKGETFAGNFAMFNQDVARFCKEVGRNLEYESFDIQMAVNRIYHGIPENFYDKNGKPVRK